jgi:hypothetical protein
LSNVVLTAKEQQNENNISWNTNHGVKNLCKPNVSADSEITYTVNADNSITVTCNTTTIRDVRIFTDLSGLTDGKDYILSGCSGGDYSNTYGFAVRTSSSVGKAFESDGETTFTKTAEMVKMDLIIRAGQNWTKTFYPMIRPAEIKDSTYQPYAMSNVELTAEKVDRGDQFTSNTAKTYTVENDKTYMLTVISYGNSCVFLLHKYASETDTRIYTVYKSTNFDSAVTIAATANSNKVVVTPNNTWFFSTISCL